MIDPPGLFFPLACIIRCKTCWLDNDDVVLMWNRGVMNSLEYYVYYSLTLKSWLKNQHFIRFFEILNACILWSKKNIFWSMVTEILLALLLLTTTVTQLSTLGICNINYFRFSLAISRCSEILLYSSCYKNFSCRP